MDINTYLMGSAQGNGGKLEVRRNGDVEVAAAAASKGEAEWIKLDAMHCGKSGKVDPDEEAKNLLF
ncbi:hypothetical protein T265_00822 [Opisthorchis viverrini]|uniref:Uncharacterized protein n=1 Tax=Opisthorchis viverrini TaxID=6198 RepID=A0A075ABV1_OPIVI|nr:hypothetical protein T265_00822 [Opisthorchis viverrini]KER33330.1 hypothetical protein T265_00822 [Opisthorchis viverrini]